MTNIWQRIRGRGERAGLTCIQVVELVTSYLEGGLSEADRARFDAHLSDVRRLHELPRPDARHDRGRRPGPRRRISRTRPKAGLVAAFRGWASSE